VARKRRTLVYIPRLGPATRVKRRLDRQKGRGGEDWERRGRGEKKCNSQKTLSANQASVINIVVN